jgi:putative toxin-antitoxin system antitoxin component (TIGR02293 family)
MSANLTAVANLLGGHRLLRKRVATDLDFVELGSRGLPYSSLSHFSRVLQIPVRQMAEWLPVTERTLARYAASEQLNRPVSEHLIQLARLFARGEQVFGDRKKFRTWLELPSRLLGGRAPVALLSSPLGLELVTDELGRIEHGVYI